MKAIKYVFIIVSNQYDVLIAHMIQKILNYIITGSREINLVLWHDCEYIVTGECKLLIINDVYGK